MDKTVCIQWIGETYLEATAPVERRALGRSEFLNAWKDLLPETWRDGASLSNLPVSLSITCCFYILCVLT
jgi:sister chromatid cohesion protein DCC1